MNRLKIEDELSDHYFQESIAYFVVQRNIDVSSGEEEPSPKPISWIKNKLVTTCDEGVAAHFRHNRIIRPQPRPTYHSSTERAGCPQNTLNDDLLTISYFALRRMQVQ